MTRVATLPRLLTALLAVAFLSLGLTACAETRAETPVQGPRDLASAAPESVGMSSERLERLNDAMQGLVDDGLLAGITTMISRHGKITHFGAFGHQDIEAGAPMSEDTIFRIYSMSKPITGVALMILYEEGKFRLSDPVHRYIPEFEGLVVAAGEGPSADSLEASLTVRTAPAIAESPPT